MSNRSLDEFLASDDGGRDDAPTPVDDPLAVADMADAVVASDAATGDDRPDPVVTTYARTPDGAACAACGAVVERRWRDDGGWVCESCKAW